MKDMRLDINKTGEKKCPGVDGWGAN